MVCWLIYVNAVKGLLSEYNITDEQAKQILQDIENEVGHNLNLIKAIIDYEKQDLIKRLKKKVKKQEQKTMTYA